MPITSCRLGQVMSFRRNQNRELFKEKVRRKKGLMHPELPERSFGPERALSFVGTRRRSFGAMRSFRTNSEPTIEKKVEVVPFEKRHLATQAKDILSQEIPFMLVCILLILLADGNKTRGTTPPFFLSVWGVLFEVASAFGTCGLTLSTTSVCTATFLSPFSRYVVMLVMLAGRHRGLPRMMDPTVNVPKVLEEIRQELGNIDLENLDSLNLKDKLKELNQVPGISPYNSKLVMILIRLLAQWKENHFEARQSAFVKWRDGLRTSTPFNRREPESNAEAHSVVNFRLPNTKGQPDSLTKGPPIPPDIV